MSEELKVSAEILELAKSLKKEYKIGEGGIVEVGKDFYESHLPEGLTLKDVERVQKHNSNLVAASGLALGEVGIPHFKKDKKADQISIEFAAGKDKIGAVFQRQRTMTNPQGGEPITKYGVLTSTYKARAASNVGALKRVRQHLNDQAAKVYGS